jgi:zinc protease
MRKIIYSVVSALFLISVVQAQAGLDTPLQLDPEVRYGVLDNGMTYYIRHNEEPRNRASFYIIQNVGAILEDDHQNGLAHFLEHMAFNGTKHFPGKGILNTLERHGVAFGRNINAYTSTNETVYNLSEVPVDRPGLLDTCLLVLNDWSNYLLLTEEEIDLERGVITEEWRTRRTPRFRMYRASMPYIYNGSKYSYRDVIGDIDVIKNFRYDALRDFYNNWYRTDLQAIAIVGDFDADEMEQKVIDLFSGIPAVEDPEERTMITIPDNEEMIYGLVTDKEADQSAVTMYYRRAVEDQSVATIGQLREDYVEMLFNRMMSQRIAELLQKGEPPFVNGSIRVGTLTRGYDVSVVSITAKTNEEDSGYRTILTELERVKQHGFAPGELERAKSHYLNQMEKRVKEKDKITNDRYAYHFKAHYLENEAFMDVEEELKYMKALFGTIAPADFSARVPEWFGEKNRVVVVQGPESEDIHHLSQEEVLSIQEQVNGSAVDPYEDVEVATSLIDESLPGGSIVQVSAIPELDAEQWILSNGAKVIYRFADYEKDNISFRAYSKGGASLFDDAYVPSMTMLSNLIGYYGLGEYDMMTLQKMLTGKTVSLNVELNELSEGFSGDASPKDFETLMQMIYLRFVGPRFDGEAHQAIIGRYKAFIQNMGNNPQKAVSDSLTRILADYHPRARIMDEQYIEEVDLGMIEEVYSDRFRDASDFTFYFVGNISGEELKPYVERYIGSLPSDRRTEQWIDRGINEPEGKLEKQIPLKLEVPKSTVALAFITAMEYTPSNLVALRIIEGILDLRFVESIREEQGGTYGVSASTALEHYPEEKASLFILFDTDPEKAEFLKGMVYEELEKLVKEGPASKDFNKTVENMLKEREEAREHNAYWLNMLYSYNVNGYNFDAPENYIEIIKQMDEKDVQKVMKRLYKKANVLDVVFSPEQEEVVTE